MNYRVGTYVLDCLKANEMNVISLLFHSWLYTRDLYPGFSGAGWDFCVGLPLKVTNRTEWMQMFAA
jgi:hypothetical protein